MKLAKILAVSLCGIASWSAQAAPITGSVSVADGFVTPYGLVSTTTNFDIDSIGLVNTPTLDFDTFLNSGSPFANAGFVNTVAPGGVLFTAGGFSFTLTSALISDTGAITCSNNLCTDSRTVSVGGVVSGNSFDATGWVGVFTANGSCVGTAGACTNPATYSANWSLSLSALGNTVPEPGSLALVGLGLLLSAGAAKRRRS